MPERCLYNIDHFFLFACDGRPHPNHQGVQCLGRSVYEATTVTRSVPLTRVANWGMAAVLVGMVVVLVARFAHNVHRLAKLEPQRFRWWE